MTQRAIECKNRDKDIASDVSAFPRRPIGLLGTGKVGAAVASILAPEGYAVVLWNRTRVKAENIAERVGAAIGGSHVAHNMGDEPLRWIGSQAPRPPEQYGGVLEKGLVYRWLARNEHELIVRSGRPTVGETAQSSPPKRAGR